MLALTAFALTAAVTGIVSILLWLVGADVPVISAALKSVVPTPTLTPSAAFGITIALQFALYAALTAALRHLYRYAAETEAAPRTGRWHRSGSPTQRRQAPFWAFVSLVGANPAGYWIWPFAIPLFIIVGLGTPLSRSGIVDPRYWGLSFLLVTVLIQIASRPDVRPRAAVSEPRGAVPKPGVQPPVPPEKPDLPRTNEQDSYVFAAVAPETRPSDGEVSVPLTVVEETPTSVANGADSDQSPSFELEDQITTVQSQSADEAREEPKLEIERRDVQDDTIRGS